MKILLTGASGYFAKLTNSIQLTTQKTRMLLDWKPKTSIEAAITKTVEEYLEMKQC